jgi:anaerobic magnesium-protoporphyrin IX monomethyl ester cyclase
MRVHFVAADLEENLGVGILAAVVEKHGHEAAVVPFNDLSELERVVERVTREQPDVVGLSIQFQHRAPEFVRLARRLRAAGFRGHLTSGGQFPTLAWRETLAPENGIDSVVLHDGEETIVELLRALEGGTDVAAVPGMALRGGDGEAVRTTARKLLDDLDGVPFARRYRTHNRHMNIPFIPMIGGRGCWGKCNYCSIIAFYDDAIETGGGRAVRFRSPENIAAEMALLLEAAGGKGIFCFHDDNFVFPGEQFSLKRIRAIAGALEGYDVGRFAMIGKARPDCITPALARELAELGVIRLYIGVENGSQEGGDHLRRGTQQERVRGALAACREVGIFNCYNLLIFEPHATLEHVGDNVQFIRDHADHPVNFCRAEPYFGTALHHELGDLDGDYLGFNYRIEDDRTELCYRICAAAFRGRNFAPQGVANRYMGLGYAANVLARFYDVGGNAQVFRRRAHALTRAISIDTAEYMEKALAIARTHAPSDRDAIERKTALLGLEVAATDAHWHRELDELFADMRAFTANPPAAESNKRRPAAGFLRLKASMAASLGMSLAMAAGCDEEVETRGSTTTTGNGGGGEGGMVVDPAPGGMGGMGGESGGGGEGGMVVDPAPGGMGGMGGEAGAGGMGALEPELLQPHLQPGIQKHLPILGQRLNAVAKNATSASKPRLIDQWFDTSPKAAVRTRDLPLFDPPQPALRAERDQHGELRVRVECAGPFTTRWEAEGDVVGRGNEVTWRPQRDTDRIRVAIRSEGGVAVLSMRAAQAQRA